MSCARVVDYVVFLRKIGQWGHLENNNNPLSLLLPQPV